MEQTCIMPPLPAFLKRTGEVKPIMEKRKRIKKHVPMREQIVFDGTHWIHKQSGKLYIYAGVDLYPLCGWCFVEARIGWKWVVLTEQANFAGARKYRKRIRRADWDLICKSMNKYMRRAGYREEQ